MSGYSSSLFDSDPIKQIEHSQALFTTCIFVLVTTTLAYYDLLLTFSNEVKCIWRRKFALPTFLFAVNRYATLGACTALALQTVPYLTQHLSPTQAHTVCSIILRAHGVFSIIFASNVAVVMALRTYAITSHNIKVLVIVLALGSIRPVYKIYVFTTLFQRAVRLPFMGCETLTSLSDRKHDICKILVNVAVRQKRQAHKDI